MKHILMTAATALALTTPAFAQDQSADQLRASVANELSTMNVVVDVNKLDADQLSEIYLALTSAEMQTEKMTAIRSALGDDMMEEPMMMDGTEIYVPMNDMRARVGASLDQMGYDVDVSSLSDNQIAGLYLQINSSEMNTRNKINSLLE